MTNKDIFKDVAQDRQIGESLQKVSYTALRIYFKE